MIRALMMARSAGPFAVVCAAVVLVLLAAYSYGRASGKTACSAHYTAELAKRDLLQAQAIAEQVEAARQQMDMAAAIERRHLEDQIKREQQKKQTVQYVREYVAARPNLADCSVDAAGLRLWNSANRGNAAAAGNSASTRKRPRGADAAVRPAPPGTGRAPAVAHQ